MLPYPTSIFGYFIVGILGAITFLFLLLLFDKDVAILKNDHVKIHYMGTLYILLGGVLAVVVNLAGNPDFTANQLILAFGTGLGWPGIAAGIGAGRRVGELNQEKKKARGLNLSLEERTDRMVEEARKEYKDRLERHIKNYEILVSRANKQIEEIHSFYTKKLSSIGGG
ncbi:MAG: hypothetical protein JSW00_04630 [Thermoplasmata archaeon]|nr:MAG: hypothetical protein JSW00_04630 [Thermoplasmata archaeon]